MTDLTAERESRLKHLHPVFREADDAVATYVQFMSDKPHSSDVVVQQHLIANGVEQSVGSNQSLTRFSDSLSVKASKLSVDKHRLQ